MIFNTEDSPFYKFEELDFNLDVWLTHWYPAIYEFLEISPQSDLEASKKINDLFTPNVQFSEVKRKLKEKVAIIVAPGISLSKEAVKDIKTKLSSDKGENFVLFSVDGATSFLLEKKLTPQIIVTDLDGYVEDQLEAQASGAIMVVHIHGDNLNNALEYLPKIEKKGKFLLTTQTKEFNNLNNFLGFSDGDRAICIAIQCEMKKAILYGFDFGDKVGKYSKRNKLTEEQYTKKMKKFVIAKSIINWCSRKIELTIRQ